MARRPLLQIFLYVNGSFSNTFVRHNQIAITDLRKVCLSARVYFPVELLYSPSILSMVSGSSFYNKMNFNYIICNVKECNTFFYLGDVVLH